ncbi:hypothetical protein TNCV_1871491 [Trichonephila clavipes]|nr:hypothetical protein TNCV_1871491 [Trichonephila clavipes]
MTSKKLLTDELFVNDVKLTDEQRNKAIRTTRKFSGAFHRQPAKTNVKHRMLINQRATESRRLKDASFMSENAMKVSSNPLKVPLVINCARNRKACQIDFDVKYKTGKKHSDADALSISGRKHQTNFYHDEYEPCDGTEKGSRPCEIKTLSNSSKNEEFRFIDGILCRKNFDFVVASHS